MMNDKTIFDSTRPGGPAQGADIGGGPAPRITVIVVNWNGKRFLDTCLSSLQHQTFSDFETIFVDNGSTDGSSEYVQVNFPDVKLITLSENRGFTGGNIAGWEQARGDLIVLLNNDTEVDPGWLEEIYKASLAFPDAGSFACKMLLFDQRDRIDSCGFGLMKGGATVDLGQGEKDGPPWTEAREVFGAVGGAACYRRSTLEEVGFLDPDFFMTYEDVDLSFRAQLLGFRCVFVPGAIVYHHWHGTMRRHAAWQVYYPQRNNEIFCLKNMPLSLLVWLLPYRALYEAGACAYFCILGHARPFFAAKLRFLRDLPAILRKRREIQRSRKVTGRQLLKLMHLGVLRHRWRKLLTALPWPPTNATVTPPDVIG